MDDQYPLELFSPDETLITDPGYAVSHLRQCESEKKLLVAVLKDAISDYKKYRYSGHPRFREAESWIFGPDRDRLFAFQTVCAMLNLSAERVRKDLRNFDEGSVSKADYPPAYRACKPKRGVRTCRFLREGGNARKSQ